jgi:type I restriction enzyme S subunit
VNRIKWDDESFLPFGFDVKHKDFLLKEGDIVIAMTRPILNGKLKIAIVSKKDADSLLNQRVGSIVHENTINRDFAYQFFNSNSFITAMEKELMGTDPPNISSSMFEGLNIVLPPLLEQTKIADILSSVDNKLEVLSEKKTHYQELKQGLMQQLLTGKIRVNNLMAQI